MSSHRDFMDIDECVLSPDEVSRFKRHGPLDVDVNKGNAVKTTMSFERHPGRTSAKIPLKCEFSGCQSKKVFLRPSEFKKHKDRHIRPYKCDIPDCMAPSFGDAGGLGRHQREVHRLVNSNSDDDNKSYPIAEYFCPEASCQRSRKGFPRRWNLMEHQKRVHHVVVPERGEIKRGKRSISILSSASTIPAGSVSTVVSPTGSPIYERKTPLRSPASPDGHHVQLSHARNYDAALGLQATLRALEEKRIILERDIEAVKHAMQVVQVQQVHVGGQ